MKLVSLSIVHLSLSLLLLLSPFLTSALDFALILSVRSLYVMCVRGRTFSNFLILGSDVDDQQHAALSSIHDFVVDLCSLKWWPNLLLDCWFIKLLVSSSGVVFLIWVLRFLVSFFVSYLYSF